MEPYGEQVIRKYLNLHHFTALDNLPNNVHICHNKWFIHSYQPNWLKGLHLDFFVHYEDINVGIEFDGRQHFSCDQHFYGNNYAAYQVSREHDRKKDMKCSIRRVPLIRLEDIGDMVSTNPLIAKKRIYNALTTSLSRALYLQMHSHICGVIKEPISWYNAYYRPEFKQTVINECLENAETLLQDCPQLSQDLVKLVQSHYAGYINRRISTEVNQISLLVKSTVAKLGVLKPKLEKSLKCIQNDILMGLFQFYTHPGIYSPYGNSKYCTYSKPNYNERDQFWRRFDNNDDEQLTCQMITQFAQQTIDDVKVVKYDNKTK